MVEDLTTDDSHLMRVCGPADVDLIHGLWTYSTDFSIER
jgi:hypothetical protein